MAATATPSRQVTSPTRARITARTRIPAASTQGDSLRRNSRRAPASVATSRDCIPGQPSDPGNCDIAAGGGVYSRTYTVLSRNGPGHDGRTILKGRTGKVIRRRRMLVFAIALGALVALPALALAHI